MLFKAIFRHRICVMLSVPADDKDGNGLKLEKAGPTFSCFNAMPVKSPETLSWLVLPDKICSLTLLQLYRSIF